MAEARLGRAATLLVAAASAALYLVPDWLGLDPGLGPPAAMVVLAIGFWASGALPAHVTALLVFALVTVLEIAPPSVIFAGFAATSMWLVFGGLVIAAAIEATGLGRRLARLVVGRITGSYRRIVYVTVGLNLAIAFLVPAAMGRIVILLPIFAALARELGFAPGSRGHNGILIAVAFGTFMPAFAILPANLPNMVLLGGMETIHGLGISYGEYLLWHFPVLGLAKAVLIAELVCRLFPAEVPGRELDEEAAPAEPWSAPERALFLILIGALVLWGSDWLHGVSPGWVALLAGLACLLPPLGILDVRGFEGRVQFSTLFYVAGLLGMVSLIDQSGLGTALGEVFLAWLPLEPGAAAANLAALAIFATLLGLFTAIAGIPAVLTPLAPAVAEAAALPIMSVLMVQVIAFSAMPFPYQSPPLMVALQMAGISLAVGTRFALLLSLLTLAFLMPLEFLWWRALGLLS